jgi:hypothetical protein
MAARLLALLVGCILPRKFFRFSEISGIRVSTNYSVTSRFGRKIDILFPCVHVKTEIMGSNLHILNPLSNHMLEYTFLLGNQIRPLFNLL